MAGYQVNPAQLIKMIRSGNNPQQLMMSVLEQRMSGNPLYENLLALAKDNNTSEIEMIARNLTKERGLDFDKEFAKFKKMLGF